MQEPILLVDGDILIYQAASAVEHELEFEPDLFVMFSNLADAKDKFIESLNFIVGKANVETYHLCLTDDVNWRKSVYPEYKSNRKNTRKPMGFKEFKQWVKDEYPVVIKPTLEADDVLGILATKPGNNAVIWSIDKDLMQIPGKHLIDGKLTTVSPVDADWVHMAQTLTGDPVDGYPGCKGIGKIKADKIIQTAVDTNAHLSGNLPQAVWPAIVETYVKAGFTEADALVQARVARICRWENWDGKKQEVRLWSPSNVT